MDVNPDMEITDNPSAGDDPTGQKRNLRERGNRRPLQVKIRQKRQVMQNMTKPLKQWLCKHRDNPYPSKLDKEILARDSQMSLTQVANWFANARRRLKNAVKGDNLPWSTRVKLYNSHVDGNAELLSLSSDDSLFDSDENIDDPKQIQQHYHQQQQHQQQQQQQQQHKEHHIDPILEDIPVSDDVVPSRSHTPISCPSFPGSYDLDLQRPHRAFDTGTQCKFKQTILQRYLSDTLYQSNSHIDMEVSAFNKTRCRKPSGSIGSRDYEEMSTASGISSNESHHLAVFDDTGDDLEAAARRRRISGDVRQQEDISWKEISAAMALTSLARSRKYPLT